MHSNELPIPVLRRTPPARVRRRALAGAACLLASVLACGGSEPTAPPSAPSGNGTMSASVDGVAWSSRAPVVVRSNGIISIAGSNTDQLGINFAFVDEGPKVYAIPGSVGLNLNVTQTPQAHVWQALGMGQLGGVGSGSVTVTTLTSTRVAGTFTFTAPAVATSGATGARTVTNGQFDLTF